MGDKGKRRKHRESERKRTECKVKGKERDCITGN